MYPARMEPRVQVATITSLIASFLVFWLVNKLPFVAPLAEPIRLGVESLITAFVTSLAAWLVRHTPDSQRNVERSEDVPR